MRSHRDQKSGGLGEQAHLQRALKILGWYNQFLTLDVHHQRQERFYWRFFRVGKNINQLSKHSVLLWKIMSYLNT